MENTNRPRTALAKSHAQKIHREIGFQNPPLLLRDVVNYLKKSCALEVFSWNFGDNIDGMQMTQGNDIAIGYSATQHQHRQRFTVAHEIGHLVLGHTQTEIVENLGNDHPFEVEADQFAAELLMPEELIKNQYRQGVTIPKELAKMYFVSEQAMWVRLLECRLIK